MIHKGEIIEKAVRSSGFSISTLAKRLNKSRRHIYNIFENPNVGLELILEIGKIIKYDFTDEIPIFEKSRTNTSHIVIENKDEEKSWKDKYFELLEKYNELLTEHISIIKK